MIFALLFSAALAQEMPDALHVPVGTSLTFSDDSVVSVPVPSLLAPLGPPAITEGVALVPAGSLLLLKREDGSFEPRLAGPKSFLLPEPMYDSARLQARQLQVCQPALDAIAEETLQMADRTYAALATCGSQFDTDEVLIQDLTGQVSTLETRALVAEDRLKVARKNSMVAWAVTGGILFGGTTAIVLSLAN